MAKDSTFRATRSNKKSHGNHKAAEEKPHTCACGHRRDPRWNHGRFHQLLKNYQALLSGTTWISGRLCQEGNSRVEARGWRAKAESRPRTPANVLESSTDRPLPTTVLEWVQTCDLQTLLLSSPYFSQGAQNIFFLKKKKLGTALKVPQPKCHHTVSLFGRCYGKTRDVFTRRMTHQCAF